MLQRYKILEGSEQFNAAHVARTAALVFGIPFILVALNERYRDWYHCAHGVDANDHDRLQAFCAHANLSEGAFFVEDVRRDTYFANNPAVTDSPRVGFFAGAPLHNPEGKRFGTMCLIDSKPRKFTQVDLDILVSFALLVGQDICLRSAGRYAIRDLIESEEDKCTLFDLAMTDPLTQTLNRRAFFRFSEREVSRASRYGTQLAVLMLDIDHFKQVNDVHGHAVGDVVLKAMVKTISDSIRDEDLIGRLGGEEFAIVLPQTSPERAEIVANRLRQEIKALTFEGEGGTFNVTISIGISEPTDSDMDIVASLERSDKALYTAKRNGRDRVVIAPYGWLIKQEI